MVLTKLVQQIGDVVPVDVLRFFYGYVVVQTWKTLPWQRMGKSTVASVFLRVVIAVSFSPTCLS